MDVECPIASRTVGDQQRVASDTTSFGTRGTFGFDATCSAGGGEHEADRPGRPRAGDRPLRA